MSSLLTACSRVESPQPTPPPVYYRLAADDVSFPLLQALSRAYQERHPWVRFTIEKGNARWIDARVTSGQAQLAAVASLPAFEGTKGWFTDLAMDGVAVITNKQNPIETLSVADTRAIFAGERNQWADYNVSGLGDIKVAVRESDDATRKIFDRNIMGAQRLTLEALVMSSADVMMRYVALNPGAIGYVPVSQLRQHKLAIKALSLDGRSPTPQAITSGTYPLGFSIYFFAAREPHDELRQFVLWSLDEEGRRVIEAIGYTLLP